MSSGFRVFTKRELPPPEMVEAFRKFSAANVADCMGRLSAMNAQIRLMSPRKAENMAGVALTVKARPGDNLMFHKALDLAGAGDVLVLTNEGAQSHSLMGEIMFAYAAYKKVAGIVLDGPIRDVDALNDLGIPVYATGCTPGGPYKEGPGEINVPVSCGHIAVHPGDIILGDSDGVIVIPKNDAPAILAAVKKFSAQDAAKVTAARSGKIDRSWVDNSLREKGCEIIEDSYRR
ncbi:MAG: RraA family protein [Clostridia bacterium]|nr:RraA family protein [Clostridia bacterium]